MIGRILRLSSTDSFPSFLLRNGQFAFLPTGPLTQKKFSKSSLPFYIASISFALFAFSASQVLFRLLYIFRKRERVLYFIFAPAYFLLFLDTFCLALLSHTLHTK
ncbi:hypothetical protein DL89DRAFT_20702 [Linderina pennispora]|uniref:Uncharacterized protein n=1 Tax=Linderina pennispora TaxID=61395 RepID=A0A1Y1WN64_9FUNG|nr:uncharacterized protein DL89DRAFT_20702 [Linderina pennispora]ORX74656.1 hypothetical protein DL89DRAFT_20702 [Linderina pennispora]